MEDIEKTKEWLISELTVLRQRISELEDKEVQRRKDKNDIKENERYYRSLINHIHEDILVIDRAYRITDANRTFLVTSGRKREDVIGHYCYEISHGYNKPCSQQGEDCPLLKVFETGQVHTAWHQHVHVGGWKTWVDLLLSPLRDAKGDITHVITAVRDVSDLVKAGKSLEESEKKYRRILASSID